MQSSLPLGMAARPLRVAVVADLLEERWSSMDLVAETLVSHLKNGAGRAVDVEMLRPSLPSRGKSGGRFVRRFWDYSRWLRARAGAFDVFHVIDHSYAHLVHVLPANRAVVTCHDTDAFLPLVHPGLTTSRLPKMAVRILLSGMRKAARVTCDTAATYDEACRYRLVPTDRLIVVRNGTPVGYSAQGAPASERALDRLLRPVEAGALDLLHVGSTIPRKRIDLLLRIVAAVKDVYPAVRLLKAGGSFTPEQRDLVEALGLERQVVQLPFLETDQLAALYRRATLLLLTSDREGFGLPVIEAMACGTRVVATDLKVLREVGGGAALYCDLGDIGQWRDAIVGIAQDRHDQTARAMWRAAGVAQAATFSWSHYAESMSRIYQRVARDADVNDAAKTWTGR
jgi:glycosyltransferase involved in cell wall biosynthesis